MLFKILAFIFLIPGAIIVYGSRFFVSRFKLDKNVKCDFEHEMDEEGLKQYNTDKAILNLKMAGMAIMLPGFILIFFAFR